jgi:hypothetical protein
MASIGTWHPIVQIFILVNISAQTRQTHSDPPILHPLLEVPQHACPQISTDDVISSYPGTQSDSDTGLQSIKSSGSQWTTLHLPGKPWPISACKVVKCFAPEQGKDCCQHGLQKVRNAVEWKRMQKREIFVCQLSKVLCHLQLKSFGFEFCITSGKLKTEPDNHVHGSSWMTDWKEQKTRPHTSFTSSISRGKWCSHRSRPDVKIYNSYIFQISTPSSKSVTVSKSGGR